MTSKKSKKTAAPSTDRIRNDIDRGLKGDKIAHSDPAAAPLGTDAETAGTSPTREERLIAAKQPNMPALEGDRPQPGGGFVVNWKIALMAAIFMLAIGTVLVFLRLR